MAYRVYVTDALRLIGENTAKFAGGNFITVRFADIIKPDSHEAEIDDRTAQEIVDDIVSRAGITVVKNDDPI